MGGRRHHARTRFPRHLASGTTVWRHALPPTTLYIGNGDGNYSVLATAATYCESARVGRRVQIAVADGGHRHHGKVERLRAHACRREVGEMCAEATEHTVGRFYHRAEAHSALPAPSPQERPLLPTLAARPSLPRVGSLLW